MYVTDSLQAAPQNKYKTHRWFEITHPEYAKIDEIPVNGDEVVADIVARGGLIIDECI